MDRIPCCKAFFIICMFFSSFCVLGQQQNSADSIKVVEHLKNITKTEGYRNYQDIETLDKVADYIFNVFGQYADTVYFQPYTVDGNIYKNVICRFGKNEKPLIVVGAHYDVCGNQEGADDNASGVVGLLELARLLKEKSSEYPIEIVAYTLEEPPFFRTEFMGSFIHAKSLNDSKRPVYGMFALEMIGYFKEAENTQSYPVKPMKIVYGTKGDYILLAKQTSPGKFVKNFSKKFNDIGFIKTKNLKAPSKLQGVDFSDHLNYWKFNYDALMVTNTAFYRNKNYHQVTDKMETLDISKMVKVINTVYETVVNMP